MGYLLKVPASLFISIEANFLLAVTGGVKFVAFHANSWPGLRGSGSLHCYSALFAACIVELAAIDRSTKMGKNIIPPACKLSTQNMEFEQ